MTAFPDAPLRREQQIVPQDSKRILRGSSNNVPPRMLSPQRRSNLMRKIILTLAAVAAVGTAAVAPAEARGFGRGAAIGVGIGAAALGAAVAAGAYNNGYYGSGYGYGYAPADGYYDNPGYYYDDGPRVYQRRVYRGYDAW